MRAHCEAREHELQALRTRIAVLDAMQQQHGGASGSRDGLSADTSSALAAMDAENARLRAALTDRDTQIVELQKQLREKVCNGGKLCTVTSSASFSLGVCVDQA